ncbi:hypothetical protein IV203_029744 [Nitzschia inconspicua]|uniref:DUF6824 domain-containing protein n=1 Tax=Nitzschia inconspicua TaxID=303405 RepID=A0A9K3LSC3_9STRA|nr:hypothetical protein IV203_029744 [Nitzschia inconspicua]
MEDKPAASKMESPSVTREQHEGNLKEMLAVVDRNSFHHHDAGAHSNFEPCKTLSSDDDMEIVEPSTTEDDDSPGIELPPGIMDDPLTDDLRSNSISSPDGSEKHSSSENRLLLAEEQKMEDIETPHRNDVLCGRGVTTNRWVGNENFRAIVGLNKEMYVTSTKRQKMAISRSIVEAVRSLNPPGRFLDKDPQTGLWYDVGHKKAVEKTSQALRDGAAILRKQLSADLGDPDFLNSVFDEDSNSPEKQNKDAEKKEKGSGSGKENNKGKSPEKVKPIKAKPSNVKKGHRRVRSNPSVLGVSAAISAARREKIEEPLEDPRHYPSPNYGMFPPAPHSPGPHAPPPRHARSLPNSPMTWGGGPRTSFHPDSPGSFPPHHHHHHPPYHHSPPPTFSPYSKQASHAPYSGSHPFDHHTRGHSSPHDNSHSPRHHSWSPYGSHHPPPYHHPQHHQHYLHPPPPHAGHYPPPPAGGRPTSPSLGHPKFSSNGYYPPHAPTPEWSPRRVNHHPGYHYSPHRGEYTPTRSASWTPRGASPHDHRGDHHHHEDYPDDHDDSGGLSVPSLGGSKSFDGERFSPKVHLTPRMKPIPSRSMETPPRPPAHYRHRAFSPPTSPHLRRPKSKEGRILECSPIEEEKKSPELNERMEDDVQAKEAKKADDVPQKNEKNHAVSEKKTPSNSSNFALKRDNLPKLDNSDGEEKSNAREDIQQRDSSEIDFKVDDLHETRASPGLFLSIDDDGNVEAMPRVDYDDENQYVEDIAMSPLAYDREDPITLMDLPDNLLSLPISPCGPNDDPQPGCFSCLS